jgi:hypothetical protein
MPFVCTDFLLGLLFRAVVSSVFESSLRIIQLSDFRFVYSVVSFVAIHFACRCHKLFDRLYFCSAGGSFVRFDKHGSTKLKDFMKITPGLRVDVIGLKDDDAFYFSLIRRGQKTLHLRSFSPIDGLEWVRIVASRGADVSPERYLTDNKDISTESMSGGGGGSISNRGGTISSADSRLRRKSDSDIIDDPRLASAVSGTTAATTKGVSQREPAMTVPMGAVGQSQKVGATSSSPSSATNSTVAAPLSPRSASGPPQQQQQTPPLASMASTPVMSNVPQSQQRPAQLKQSQTLPNVADGSDDESADASSSATNSNRLANQPYPIPGSTRNAMALFFWRRFLSNPALVRAASDYDDAVVLPPRNNTNSAIIEIIQNQQQQQQVRPQYAQVPNNNIAQSTNVVVSSAPSGPIQVKPATTTPITAVATNNNNNNAVRATPVQASTATTNVNNNINVVTPQQLHPSQPTPTTALSSTTTTTTANSSSAPVVTPTPTSDVVEADFESHKAQNWFRPDLTRLGASTSVYFFNYYYYYYYVCFGLFDLI